MYSTYHGRSTYRNQIQFPFQPEGHTKELDYALMVEIAVVDAVLNVSGVYMIWEITFTQF